MPKKKVMVVFGTRPEAIKMAPVIDALRLRPDIQTRVVVTGQHRQMLDQALHLFEIQPDEDLKVMRADQGLPDLFSRIITGVTGVISRYRPNVLLVHGDTSTTLAAALAGFYAGVSIGHVEAGLRTGDITSPWPEEMNRRLVSPLAAMHFAPTESARLNLLAERIPNEQIRVTGNTVIDALLRAVAHIDKNPRLGKELDALHPFLEPTRKLILVTGHRRESFGAGLVDLCRALSKLANHANVQVVYPVHLNPNVQAPVHRLLGNRPNVHLIEPLDYLPFVRLMTKAHVIITDSGGVQEEAPSLGKPVLVTRAVSERMEGLTTGTAKLVGTDPDQIYQATMELLEDSDLYDAMSASPNPYGDGRAADRIVDHIQSLPLWDQ